MELIAAQSYSKNFGLYSRCSENSHVVQLDQFISILPVIHVHVYVFIIFKPPVFFFEQLLLHNFNNMYHVYTMFIDERVGNVVMVLGDSHQLAAVKSQVELIVRKNYSNPPSHGARIVAAVLNNAALNTEWYMSEP